MSQAEQNLYGTLGLKGSIDDNRYQYFSRYAAAYDLDPVTGVVRGLIGPDGQAVSLTPGDVSMLQIAAGPTSEQIAAGMSTSYRVSDGPSAGAVVTVAIPQGGTSPAFVWDIWPQSQFTV